MALGSTQPLTEMSTRSISWEGKGGRCVRLTTLPPSCAIDTKPGNLNFLEPSGPLSASSGTDLHFYQINLFNIYIKYIYIYIERERERKGGGFCGSVFDVEVQIR